VPIDPGRIIIAFGPVGAGLAADALAQAARQRAASGSICPAGDAAPPALRMSAPGSRADGAAAASHVRRRSSGESGAAGAGIHSGPGR
jgi:hypothetical protein